MHGQRNIKKKTLIFFACIINTGRFIMFSAITNIYNKKIKGPTLMEVFTCTKKLNFFFDN